jgi:hypothetical protein
VSERELRAVKAGERVPRRPQRTGPHGSLRGRGEAVGSGGVLPAEKNSGRKRHLLVTDLVVEFWLGALESLLLARSVSRLLDSLIIFQSRPQGTTQRCYCSH